MNPEKTEIRDFNYYLPQEKIAQHPPEQRDQSRLLIYRHGLISESRFEHLDSLLNPDDLLVFNETRVIHARLFFENDSGGKIEIFCLEPYSQKELSTAFGQKGEALWVCMVGNAKRWHGETLKKELGEGGKVFHLYAQYLGRHKDSFLVKFTWDNEMSFGEVLSLAGMIPLPPYMKRQAEKPDETRYQTTYARHEGSVAAPTAGLHFTEQVFRKLEAKQIGCAFLTLHVGAGTFKPVKSEQIGSHEMHEERLFIPLSLVEKLLSRAGRHRIVAVGTTSLRALESLYWFGAKILDGENPAELFVEQWEPYRERKTYPVREALAAVKNYMESKNIPLLSGSTKIIIAPPYEIKMADALITNFHQPQSTLLLLVAAFTGNDNDGSPAWKKIYQYALKNGFRFLSYGDSSILFRDPEKLLR